jgi:two-component system NtrC family sensor kinase
MPKGGKLDISAYTDNSTDEVVISFKDTGTGIEQENLNKVLEPFFTTKHEGTGLGLNLTYHVIQAHSGKLEFESKINEGTAFTIRLPLKKQKTN